MPAQQKEGQERRKILNLPPAVSVSIVLFDDLDPFAGLEGDFVVVFWEKVVEGVDVFRHLACRLWWSVGRLARKSRANRQTCFLLCVNIKTHTIAVAADPLFLYIYLSYST